MALSDDEQLLVDYNMWRAQVEVSGPDTSPQAFMIDRVKSMAVERIEDALKYLTDDRQEPDMHKREKAIRAILEGVDLNDGSEDTTDREAAEPEYIEDDWFRTDDTS